MKRRILSVILVLCLFFSSQSVAYAWQEVHSPQENVLTERTISGQITRASANPDLTEVYENMIALQNQNAYKEGTTWTDYEPYSDSNYYRWNGGTLNGVNIVAVGCVAFAFILSDEAFGGLPARMYAAGEFTFEDIKVGDILRVNNDTHTVIVLEVSDTGVVVAEGNFNSSVHWGRAISKEDVMSSASHYITRYPEGYVPPDDPTANDIVADGTLDGGLTWTLTKAGTMTISGSGAMPDFGSAGDQPWNSYGNKIRKVVIGDGVTSIGSCAFWSCGVLSAEISSSVTTIGNSAFRGSSIISVTVPSGVKTIGDSAFRECQNLSSVTVAEGVETIGQNAFRSCGSLTSIALPASIGEVGAAAFLQCTEMKSATFAVGSKQVKLGDNLFTECHYLMRVTLPQSIERIGEGMFQNCLMLAGVEIPQGAESIEASAFASCSSMTTVLIPDSVKTIGIAAFSNCPLTDIYFTGTEAQWNSISKIGDTASAVSKATIHYEYSPDTPTDPDTPTGPDTPTDPDTPTGPDTPTDPDTPTGPDTPTDPDTPTGPDAPTDPDTPAGPDTPTDPDTPAGPDTPTVPEAQPDEATEADTATPETAAAPAQTPAPDTGVPFIHGSTGKTGWEAIKEETANAFEGKRINVNMNGVSTVPGHVLDSVKGQNVTIYFDMGDGIIWSVNGRNVTADHANDVNLSVQTGTSSIPQNIVNHVAGDRQTTQLSLAHSGDFGYNAVLMIDVGSANAGLFANLFYYNESAGGLEFVTAGQINEKGIAELMFTHASDYVIVIGDDVMAGSSGKASSGSDGSSLQGTGKRSPKTGEFDIVTGSSDTAELQHGGSSLNFMWLLMAGAVGIAVMGAITCLIQKKEKE